MSDPLLVGQGALAIEAAPRDATPPRPHTLYGGTIADPHFVGFDGQIFDVMGDPGRFYCLLSMPALQVNARFAGLDGGLTIVDQVGLKVPGTGIYLDLTIERNRPVVLCNHGRVDDFKRIDPGIGGFKGGILVLDRRTLIHAGDFLIEVVYCLDHGAPHPRYGKLDRPHLDLYFHAAGQIDELRPKERPHGLLGVTARGPYTPRPDALQGEGVLDMLEPGSTYRDYEVSGLWADDFKFNQYRG